ncbi:MAG: outer membrane beta-barrel protein [Candidatus Aureabacteria bacterium]|nr:outer membrane beta-barrel protein [Candidatus Auribacterota bacterium]
MKKHLLKSTILSFVAMFLLFQFVTIGYSDITKKDALKRKAIIDQGDFLTKEDYLTNKDLPSLEGVKLGNFLLHAILTTEVEHDSNVYLDGENDEEVDTILLINPAIGLVLPIKDFTLGVGYDLEKYFFNNFTNEDHTDKYLSGLAEYKLTDYTITLRNMNSNFSHRSGTEDRNRIKRDDNEFRADIGAQFDQLGFKIGYTNKKEDYLSDELLTETLTYNDKDKTVESGDIQFSYRMMPKTSILIEWGFGKGDYDSVKSPDYEFDEFLIGLKGDLRHNLSTHFKLGYKNQDYEESAFTVNEDFNSPVIRGGIEYLLTEDDILNLAVEKNVYESTYLDLNHYDTSYIGLTHTHIFNAKITSSLFGSYQENDYPTSSAAETLLVGEARLDKFYRWGLRLRYYIRDWLSTQGAYEYKRRDSNVKEYEYEVNLWTLRVSAGF